MPSRHRSGTLRQTAALAGRETARHGTGCRRRRPRRACNCPGATPSRIARRARTSLKGGNKSFMLIAVILAQDRQTGRVPRIPANRPRRSAMRRPWPDRGLSSTRYDLRQCSCRPRAMTPAPVAARNFVAELCNFLGGSPRKPVKVRRTQKWNCVRALQVAWNSSSVRADPR